LNIDAIQSMVDDRVGRSDIQFLRASQDELRAKIDGKPDTFYIDSEVGNLKAGLEDVRRE
jgi:hypothetical protein